MSDHPCVRCGACCSYFRVAFYWREAVENRPHNVPVNLTEDLDQFHKAMKGTQFKTDNRCVALSGKVGKRVGCTIYDRRPTPCRAFQASFVDGKTRNKRCDEARIQHGLPMLRPEDWENVSEPTPTPDPMISLPEVPV